MQPLIGITTDTHIKDNGWIYTSVYNETARAIEAAGGLPINIPTQLNEPTLRALYERLDGVVLPGGPDVNPIHYGASSHPKLTPLDNDRDNSELPLARWAVEDDRPVFGICRGNQVLNVALGGTLFQDMGTDIEQPINPHNKPNHTDRALISHTVAITPDSRLAAIMGSTKMAVNSLHHQSIRQVAPDFVTTAVAPDGVVEAIENPSKRFALSVQWHPEDLYKTNEAMRRLFEEFVAAAREFAEAKLSRV